MRWRSARAAPSRHPTGDHVSVELKKFWGILVRRRMWILAVLVGTVLATMFVSLKLDKVYLSKARVRLEKASEASTLVPGLNPEFGAFQNITQNPAYTEATAVGSAEVLQPVIDKLHLQKRVSWLDRTIGKPKPPRALRPDELVSESFLTGILQERIVSVEMLANTDIIEIAGYDTSLTGAMTLANEVTASYVNFMQRLKQYESEEGLKMLSGQLKAANADLAEKQAALRAFQERHNVVNLDEQSKSAVEQLANLQDRLTETSRRLTTTQGRLRELTADLDKLREPQPVTQQVEGDPQIQNLLTRLSDLSAQLQAKLAVQTLEHPEVLALRQQIDDTRSSLQREVQRVFNISISDLKAEATQLRRDIDAQQSTMGNIPEQEVQLASLQHQVDGAQRTVLALQGNMDAARAAQGLNLSNVTVLQWGMLPDPYNPYYPKPALYIVIAMFVGLLLGAGLAFLVDSLDQSYRTQEGAQQGLRLPLAGHVTDPAGVASSLHGAALANSGALELGHNASRLVGSGKSVVLLTCAVPKDDKSPVAAVLATALARRGVKTVLIDLDPRVQAMADATASPGMSAVVFDGVAPLDAVRATKQENLSYVALGSRGADLSAELDSPQVVRALRAYREAFDATLVNGPALLPHGEVIALTSAVDAVLLIVGLNRTQAPTALHAKRRLEDANAPLAGLVVSSA